MCIANVLGLLNQISSDLPLGPDTVFVNIQVDNLASDCAHVISH